jgi:hypothetical protein
MSCLCVNNARIDWADPGRPPDPRGASRWRRPRRCWLRQATTKAWLRPRDLRARIVHHDIDKAAADGAGPAYPAASGPPSTVAN